MQPIAYNVRSETRLLSMEKPNELKQIIFGLIFLLSNKLQNLGNQITKEITLKQWLLLNMIAFHVKSKPNYNDIANSMGVSRQNIIKMVSILSRKGYLRVNISPNDHRSVEITLTLKSKTYFKDKNDLGNQLLEKIFLDFNFDDLNHLNEYLTQLKNNISYMIKEI